MTIKNVEVSIIDRAWERGFVRPQPPEWLSGRTVAVIGSGPAGLAAAQQLTRAGHTVAVYERADKIGGLLRYGIPEFKMEKKHLDRRLDQMRREGTVFRAGVDVGNELTAESLRDRYDAVVLAMGATDARDLPVTGRELDGIHQAMEYLPQSNRASLGEEVAEQITAEGKDVVIIGGGDTGADCLGTATRQGARSITQLEILPEPPQERPAGQPWPTYPMTFRVSSAHEEAGDRVYAVSTKEFLGDDDGHVRALHLVEVEFKDGKFEEIEGSDREIPAQLVLFAMGFVGPEKPGLVEQLGVDLDERGNIVRDAQYMTSVSGVFVAGDAGPRPVADRLGDRRGPGRRLRRRPAPHRLDHAALPDQAHRATPRRLTGAESALHLTSNPPSRRYCAEVTPTRRWRLRVVGTIQSSLGLPRVRRAKIVCTLGPATSSERRIRELVYAGMDVARLNMSHGTHEDHAESYRLVREASDASGHGVGILADLQGPKIRLENFSGGPVQLSPGPGLDDHHPRRRRHRRDLRYDVQGARGRRRPRRPDPDRRRQGPARG